MGFVLLKYAVIGIPLSGRFIVIKLINVTSLRLNQFHLLHILQKWHYNIVTNISIIFYHIRSLLFKKKLRNI